MVAGNRRTKFDLPLEVVLPPSLIANLEAGHPLSRAQAAALMETLLQGQLDTPEIVRLLLALNRRPIRAEELTGFAMAMRRCAATVFPAGSSLPEHMVDTCGTGGDGANTFNISTAAAIVAAAAGARVAKHGNRSASSQSGSADVLEALGVRIDIPLERSGQAIREIGIGFLFAQTAHSATKYATAARKEIRVRTVLNLLGPLTNPAGAPAQVLGVNSAEVLAPVAEALRELGAVRAFVVHGAGGLDEISLAGETLVAEVRGGTISRYVVTPETFGVPRAPLQAITGGSTQENAQLITRIFATDENCQPLEDKLLAARAIVAVNAGAALVAAGAAEDFLSATKLALQAIASRKAQSKLAELVVFTNRQT
jgi:anthranilate phosphoribosyltransferase